MIDKIFYKEKKYSVFYIVLPMLLWIEGLVYVVLSPNSSSVSGFVFVFAVVCSVTTIVLWVVYNKTLETFWRQYSELTKEQKDSLKECGIVKIWNVYLSTEVLVQYEMFKKQIILIDDIKSVHRKKGIRAIKAGASRISEEFDEMIITLKSNHSIVMNTSSEMIEAINALLTGKRVKLISNEKIQSIDEKPIEGITALILVGSIVVFIGGYTRFMQLFIQTEQQIEKVLFLYGYESVFWLGAVCITGVCILCVFLWRAVEKRKKKHSTGMFTIWGVITVLLIMYVYVEYDNKYNEYTQAARADYELYMNGTCEHIVANSIEENCNPYEAWGDWEVYEQIKELDVELGFIKITTNENIKNREAYLPELIVLGNVDFTWDEGKEYKIDYLKNTGIVVEIGETTVINK